VQEKVALDSIATEETTVAREVGLERVRPGGRGMPVPSGAQCLVQGLSQGWAGKGGAPGLLGKQNKCSAFPGIARFASRSGSSEG